MKSNWGVLGAILAIPVVMLVLGLSLHQPSPAQAYTYDFGEWVKKIAAQTREEPNVYVRITLRPAHESLSGKINELGEDFLCVDGQERTCVRLADVLTVTVFTQ
jgi:alpha/beta superfamily hydrolase